MQFLEDFGMLELVGYAAKEIAKLQEDAGTQAEVIIDRGDVHKLLNRAAERAGGDVLSSAHAFRRSFGRKRQRLRDHSRVAHPRVKRVRIHEAGFI